MTLATKIRDVLGWDGGDSPEGNVSMDKAGPEEHLTPDSYRRLKAKGMNKKQIAQYFGKTPSAVSHMIERWGLKSPYQKMIEAHWPWEVRGTEAQISTPFKRLRAHVKVFVEGPSAVSKAERGRLLSFYMFLRANNYVVEYHPDIPASPGTAGIPGGTPAGWRYTERLPTDGHLMIRINSETRILDEEGARVWRMPDHDFLTV